MTFIILGDLHFIGVSEMVPQSDDNYQCVRMGVLLVH